MILVIILILAFNWNHETYVFRRTETFKQMSSNNERKLLILRMSCWRAGLSLDILCFYFMLLPVITLLLENSRHLCK